jgi:hypothetical protein
MEKKTYHSPHITLRPLATETLLAASGTVDPTSVSGGTSTEEATDGYASTKRHYSVWDETSEDY